jgi:flagellar biosynthetic protein FlhB
MAEAQFQEKTEKATPKRREEARQKGQVAKSRELASVAVLGMGLITLYFYGGWLTEQLGKQLSSSMTGFAAQAHHDADMVVWLWHAAKNYLRLLLPLMIALVIAAILANLLQVGFLFSTELITPKWSKLDPLKGLKRLVSLQALAELAKSLGKIIVVGAVAFFTLKGELYHLLPLTGMSCGQISVYLGSTVVKLIQRGFWAMLILALLDYLYQRWEFERNLKMTKQEVKEEYKQTEGDPQVKARIRSLQRTMARKRMMAEVPRADVVITNPLHLAVALRYDAASMQAPTIVAKGAGILAQRIKDLALEHDIPLVEDKPLAQNLYRLVDIDEEIPAALYRAVAEILAHVYKLKGRLHG